MPDAAGVPPRSAQVARTDPTAIVESLLRTWQTGAGRITVTFGGGQGDQWDVERSLQRGPVTT